jgi:hypothetical protein
VSTAADLSKLDSFGDVAAEEDAVLDYFLTTDAVRNIGSHAAFLVLGRKGAGKTALVRYFSEGQTEIRSSSLNLRSYPWNVHATRVDRGASDIEAYVATWRYVIAAELALLVLQDSEGGELAEAQSLQRFFRDNYGGTNVELGTLIRPQSLKLSRASFEPTVLGNKLGSVALERNSPDHNFGLELNALTDSILEAIRRLGEQTDSSSLHLHFDELDQGLSTLDTQRERMLVGLILAARDIRQRFRESSVSVSPVVYLRTDIWDDLQFSDKNKISQGLALHLEWTNDALLELVNIRLRARLGDSSDWDAVAEPALMRGSQTKWNHILARTFSRPRDVIRFLNAALAQAKQRNDSPLLFANPDIVEAREEYSSYLKEELDDEVTPHWPRWEEALQACSSISTITFDREDFAEEYEARRSTKNDVDSDEALRLLHRFSVIGYERRSGYGGSSWAFQYTDPDAGWDSMATRFKVHLGLKEFAKLREERR